MCNRYESPEEREIERAFHIGRNQPGRWWDEVLFPRGQGPFIRQAGDEERELVVGQWALIPWFAKAAQLKYSMNNARAEELAEKASYREPWAKSQRCIIPARSFDEPCWETGKNQWWTFRPAESELWGLAGLWNTWTNNATGELVESYTMLTLNADEHPLMRRMHKPKPKLPPDKQDKRSVIPLAPATWEQWLTGSVQQAKELLKLPPPEAFVAMH